MFLIQFSSQIGSKEASNFFVPYHMLLNECFFKLEEKYKYFKTVEFLSIVFRVSGDVKDFKSSGPEFLKKLRGRPVYTIDYVIPQEDWENRNELEFKKYLVKGINDCFVILTNKLRELKEIIDEETLFSDFYETLEIFMNHPLVRL